MMPPREPSREDSEGFNKSHGALGIMFTVCELLQWTFRSEFEKEWMVCGKWRLEIYTRMVSEHWDVPLKSNLFWTSCGCWQEVSWFIVIWGCICGYWVWNSCGVGGTDWGLCSVDLSSRRWEGPASSDSSTWALWFGPEPLAEEKFILWRLNTSRVGTVEQISPPNWVELERGDAYESIEELAGVICPELREAVKAEEAFSRSVP